MKVLCITQCYTTVVRRVFKTRTFKRWSRKANIGDDVLCAAVKEMVLGLIDADLGGRVFKKRVPVPGRGKRGGARTIVGSNLQDRWFFLFGFEKKDRETIDDRELAALQSIAAALLGIESKLLERAVLEGELEEICREEKSPAE
ncbi:MAG TPA: type II toxin-antitoxin system RelE/ParE family toxin [Terriglobales bacterium]|nr:type II toxin-antitoxin system RelE/ParE family toxin [Terriglobales bacterium]